MQYELLVNKRISCRSEKSYKSEKNSDGRPWIYSASHSKIKKTAIYGAQEIVLL